MSKNVMLWAGAGQIGMAIARRMGHGMKIVVGDKKLENAQAIAKIMNEAGYDVVPMEMDLSSRASIKALIAEGRKYGEITMLANAAGVSPSQAPVEAILKVDLYGTAVLLEEVGKVIAPGGVGVTISSQSGYRMEQLTAEQNAQLATTPTEELLSLDRFSPNRSGIPSTPTRWRSGAMKSGSWPKPSSGGSGAPASMPSPPASSPPRWLWMSSMGRTEIFTRICLPNVPPAAPVRRTRWQMWPNC